MAHVSSTDEEVTAPTVTSGRISVGLEGEETEGEPPPGGGSGTGSQATASMPPTTSKGTMTERPGQRFRRWRLIGLVRRILRVSVQHGARAKPRIERTSYSRFGGMVMVRMSTDPRTRNYVERRTKESLSKKEIIRCLKRYVVREVYPRLERVDEP